jgi:hypothetical protein
MSTPQSHFGLIPLRSATSSNHHVRDAPDYSYHVPEAASNATSSSTIPVLEARHSSSKNSSLVVTLS